ncbi:hypothetical protein GCM10022287_23850 [Gryllotalpicola koreensis]|uniref:Uncharacterized protein n=1 Tax=Gryllotalpicola koreensis TaxID=993086 RepID=A0ABP8A339_9MICO
MDHPNGLEDALIDLPIDVLPNVFPNHLNDVPDPISRRTVKRVRLKDRPRLTQPEPLSKTRHAYLPPNTSQR